MFKFIIGAACAYLVIASFSANAALVNNGDWTTDTVSGLDWLDLNQTNNVSYDNALNNLSSDGWRYATNVEVEVLFSVAFDGYYNTTTRGYSSLTDSAYADQIEDAAAFQSLFGFTESDMFSTSTGDIFYTGTYGFYLNEDNMLRLMGVYQEDGGYNEVYGMDWATNYNSTIASGWIGAYVVRETVVPVPAAVWLFGSGLIGLIGVARRKTHS